MCFTPNLTSFNKKKSEMTPLNFGSQTDKSVAKKSCFAVEEPDDQRVKLHNVGNNPIFISALV